MKLTPAQHEQFDRDGYLFFPAIFAPEEVATLTAEVPALYARREAYNVRERGSDAVRTNFAAHLYRRRLRVWRVTRAWWRPCKNSLAKRSTCTSSRSTARWPLKATCGSGTKTTAPG